MEGLKRARMLRFNQVTMGLFLLLDREPESSHAARGFGDERERVETESGRGERKQGETEMEREIVTTEMREKDQD